MSESQGNNTLNRASSNMPPIGAATNSGATPALPPSHNMPITASPAKQQPTPQVTPAMPQVGGSKTAAATQQTASVSQPVVNHPPVAQQPTDPQAGMTQNMTQSKTAAKTQQAPVVQRSTPPTTSLNRQVDFFAEQNARTAEKKAKNGKIIRRVAIIGGIIAVLAIVGAILWFVLMGNKDNHLTREDIDNLRFTFADIYKQDQSLDDVRQRYDEILRTDIGRENAEIVKLQLLYFYVGSGFMARGVEIGETIDADKLDTAGQSAYYSQMYNAYATTGQLDKAIAAQYKAAILAADVVEDNVGGSAADNNSTSNDGNSGDDNSPGDNVDNTDNNGDNDSNNNNNQPGGAVKDPNKNYVCDGKEYSFPVECAVNGVEPNEP